MRASSSCSRRVSRRLEGKVLFVYTRHFSINGKTRLGFFIYSYNYGVQYYPLYDGLLYENGLVCIIK